ncbi:unnamed protein product [Rhizoctonia solani]|uniref:VWFA domain-containing protein n=1 Tax=Rhizoctonia solani TaxID=456999 RepID=A0A8H2WXE7_9AGAM|nr:unnamed protein product [Rhizoctonia solani]
MAYARLRLVRRQFRTSFLGDMNHSCTLDTPRWIVDCLVLFQFPPVKYRTRVRMCTTQTKMRSTSVMPDARIANICAHCLSIMASSCMRRAMDQWSPPNGFCNLAKTMKTRPMNFKAASLVQEMKVPQCYVTWCARPKAVTPISISAVTRPKDWISHATYWARSGFKDPYSQDEQNEFSKCDVLCGGPEHEATATTAANPSYCTLPIFHQPEPQQPAPLTGHVSRNGHAFECQNPSRLHQAYHIVFVIDSSGSMTESDRVPLPNTPISPRLILSCNNRYGAVLSALYGFWLSRDTAAAGSSTQARQDAYSVITFDHNSTTRLQNDFTSTTDQLIGQLIAQMGQGGTNFQAALATAQSVIETNWSSDRAPVIIFLSDGECNIADNPVYDLCRTCVRLGKALAFHSVSFGTDTYSASLRRMAEIAHEVYASAPQDVLTAARGNPCAYTNAIDSIQLADTFLGIANSLQKPRASLMNQFGSGGRRAIY